MNKFIRKTRGAISIFLALIILPVYTCAGLLVDGARLSAARVAAMGAGDLTMNAALSEYEKVLFDVYGLFAISETTEELEANVARYFTNTINNAGLLEGSDSYTRSFINSIGSLFSTGDVSFENIVDTQVEDFKLVEVSNSALGNPEVLERQIVEFMKYRAPISMGTGLLTKLGCLGETSKQTKAMEAKVNYEKKLDTVQDACETAYAAINTFNNTIDGSKYKDSDYLTKLSNDIAKAKSLTEEMTRYELASKSSSYAVSLLTSKRELRNAAISEIRELTGENINMQAYGLLKGKLAGKIGFTVDSNGDYTVIQTDFIKMLYRLYQHAGDSLESQTKFVSEVRSNYASFQEAYTYLVLLEEYYQKLTTDEKEALKKENTEYGTITVVVKGTVDESSLFRNTWAGVADNKAKAASEALYGWYTELGTILTTLTDAIDAITAVEGKVTELESERTKWNGKINDLSDSEIKASMQSDYANSAKALNPTAVAALKTLLSNNKTHFTAIQTKLGAIKYYSKQICVADGGNAGRFSGIASKEFSSWSALTSAATSAMNNYVSADVKTGITPATFSKVTEEQQFYKYLKTACTSMGGTEAEKNTATSNKEALINKGNESISADTDGMATGPYITDSGLTPEIAEALKQFASGQGVPVDSFHRDKLGESGSTDDDYATDANSNLDDIGSMLEKLGDVASVARDKVYLEEYFTEMFSCYTSGKGNEDTVSLNNHSLTNNKFYGSEVEYILYGLDTVKGNLNAAKASVFGVRFALNSIFALTNSYTRTPALTAATAIAGWTGFGVPIVQTVILLAWSMAESIYDVNELCEGNSVVVYKSSKTWQLGINGALNELASCVIDDVFAKIEATAMDSIDSINTTVKDYVEKTTEGLVESIQSTIMISLETLAIQIIGESNYNMTEADVGVKVDAFLTTLKNNATGDDAIQQATREAIDLVKTGSLAIDGSIMTVRDYLVSTIYSMYTDAVSGVTDNISKRISAMLTNIRKTIANTVEDAVNRVSEQLKTEVAEIVRQGGDQVKEKVLGKLDSYLGDMGGVGKNGTALASGFALSYKEYMKMFMILNIMGNETSMLVRCAELIQANVSQSNASFNIADALTMVEINATVSIRTTFFDIPVSTGVDINGNPVYGLDFDNLGTGRQEIKYVGLLGY